VGRAIFDMTYCRSRQASRQAILTKCLSCDSESSGWAASAKDHGASHHADGKRGFGFEPGARLPAIDRGGADALLGGFVTADKPFYFSIAVPEGS
jgi:hypothetical protein